ncbi:uncharacterized protein LOC115309885 [Ixodes scapularis]|uniref:uncharacterized protein LOC115309885 n=1 Tax=Ixodes scapularis TaxID=6945 RepID=UPI001A9F7BBD|nr:uncharacterized protein LOC115309885 [Ixodes scapularis]
MRKNLCCCLLEVCDSKARIIYIDPACLVGPMTAVWKRSSLRRAMESGLLQPSEFPLRDSGYGLAPWLITPVSGTLQPNSREARLNGAHSSVRSAVERCIGLLKNRFRSLYKHRTLYRPPQTAATIIAACAILHNVCIAAGELEPEAEEGDDVKGESNNGGPEPQEPPPWLPRVKHEVFSGHCSL